MGNIFEDNSINPFNDPEFRKKFLKDKGLLNESNSESSDEEEGYEVMDPIDKEPGKVINPIDIINNSSKIPSSVGNLIHDLSGNRNLGELNKTERALAIKSSLNKIFTEYNEKYGLSLKLNLDSTSDMLAQLADPTTFRIYQLYLSNFLDRARALVYQKILTTILLLLDSIMDPKQLLSDDQLTLSDKFVAVEKLVNMMGVFTQFQDQLKIEGAETELQKIGDDIKSSSEEGDVRSTPNVKEFMEAMLRSNGIGNKK